jgi:hypothetical protein
LDTQQVISIIGSSSLTQEQKDEIVGFKIIRADRGTNKSIVAKGMLRNVNTYERDLQTYYYPNYPYNDLRIDPFLNLRNNAFAQLCDGYTVTINSFGTGGTYADVQYTDCNTNKQSTIRYTTLGDQQLCAIGKPIIIGPATGQVGLSTYDVYTVQVCNTGFFNFSRGGRIQYNDIYEGIKTAWIDGWPLYPILVVYVVPGSSPTQIEGPGKICFTKEPSVIGANCKGETPQPGFTDKYRQIFNSPETSFGQPFLGNVLKLESVMFGKGSAHFVEVKNNAKYKLLTEEAQRDALDSSAAIGRITSPFNAAAMFAAYQSYLTIYINGITRKNYAYSFNSIADYNYGVGVPDNQGVKQRPLDIARYLIPSVLNVGDTYNINNYQRETSVFLRTDINKPTLPFADNSPNMLSGTIPIVTDKSRFTISEAGLCGSPAKEKDISVVSYYASIKNVFINQYGQIYSYDTVDTGFQHLFNENSSTATVFGGDTFISRFAYKTKLPLFIDNRVDAPDDSDIFYDEIGNIAYPKYWHSARSILKDYTVVSTGAPTTPILSNVISYKAHNFDCPNSQTLASGQPASSNPNRTFYDGYFYMFAYGIPNFYCESSYNVNLRQAFNNREGDFWPHVSTSIPDDWVQQTFVPIAQDNSYYYNVTFSKQNKENTFTNLPIDWDKPCYTYYPFRAIYSDAQNIDSDNRVNSWLIYRAISYYDFPQNYGNLTSLDGIQNRAVLARFENKTLMYNNLLTIDTSNPQAAYIGNPMMFKGAPPIDFAETDLGYVGSQHKMLLKIPQGQVTIDAKRGQVFLISGTQTTDLSAFGSGLNRFFTDHLAFEILRYFPDVPVDNHFNGIGLHGVYDSRYDRILITKLDYVPLNKNIKYDVKKNEFYIISGSGICQIVYFTDEQYFCNKGWTLSFNFNTKSWVSFHSYLPNWYIGENNFFYSGINGCCDEFDALVGVLGPIPTTTTTSSTSSTSTTSTSTSTTTSTSTSTSTTTSTSSTTTTTTTLCPKAGGLVQEAFFTGYDILSPSSSVVSTGSSSAACSAVNYLNSLPLPYTNVIPTYRVVYYQGVFIGSYVYTSDLRTDCTPAPNGWYFTGETQAANTVFRVLNGFIISINSCNVTTTTTSSSTSTTTSTSTSSTTTTTTTSYCTEWINNTGFEWLGNYTMCNGTYQPSGTIGEGAQVCLRTANPPETLSIFGDLELLGPCSPPSPTTTTTTTSPPTTTTTTTIVTPSLYIASTSGNSCTNTGGTSLPTYVYSGTQTLCGCTSISGPNISGLAIGTYYISNGTNVRQFQKSVAGSSMTATGSCISCSA